MEIEFVSTSTEKSVKLVYISKNRLKMYPGIGKSWPRTTQCIIYYDGLVKGLGEVTKHEYDVDNVEYAIKASTKKALKGWLVDKATRTQLWNLVIQEAKNYKNK